MALLQVHHLEVHYGPIRALMGIDLEVREGEIVALVGANGAGKTSTMHAICGIVPLAAGRIEYAGQRLDRLPAHRIMTRGIAHVPEGRQIFTHMTLRDNLLLGATHRSKKSHPEKDIDGVMAQFPLLQHRLSERAFNLSGGELQMLALARGLMARPKLLLLDEPSLGLAPLAVDEVFRLIDALRSQGITILLVEQNIRRALMIANRGYVLESGRVILSGPAPMLLRDDLVKRAYLGDTHHD
ncbi:MAG: hypothetical protein ETSY2_49620 [Candidatus Entotheonella gemina]|uniref:ABC transporter domain-containing protein n=1 Tax=Candidatus Entotheonella gemina TaxID=1429439 RepID=W4L9G4_9BACT|nr:MAG: hypothetical protein ETSY2_49620 [Candidatus Entotheonella gemina]